MPSKKVKMGALQEYMRKIIVVISLLLSANITFAGVGSYPNNEILKIGFYTTFGDGDVIIIGTNIGAHGTPCESGFWLSPNDPGFQSALSAILSAYHAKTKVHIHANNIDSVGINRWAGSSGWYCRIDSVGY